VAPLGGQHDADAALVDRDGNGLDARLGRDDVAVGRTRPSTATR
jgi:hypothetical protein